MFTRTNVVLCNRRAVSVLQHGRMPVSVRDRQHRVRCGLVRAFEVKVRGARTRRADRPECRGTQLEQANSHVPTIDYDHRERQSVADALFLRLRTLD